MADSEFNPVEPYVNSIHDMPFHDFPKYSHSAYLSQGARITKSGNTSTTANDVMHCAAIHAVFTHRNK